MEKKITKRGKKGDKEKEYIELLKKHPKGLTRVEIRVKTGMKPSTEQSITKRLIETKIVDKKDIWDEKIGRIAKKYYLLPFKDLADPTELHWLMKKYKTALSDNDMGKSLLIQKDIEDICLYKKIRDKKFIEFIVEEAQKIKKVTSNNEDVPTYSAGPLFSCLGHVATNLLKSIETEEESLELITGYHEKQLLNIVYSSIDFLSQVILDNEYHFLDRYEAFNVLEQFDHPKKFEVAFELLNRDSISKPGSEILPPPSFSTVRKLIILYAEINRTECRKKLYNMLTPKTNIEIKDEVMYLLEKIRLKNKDENIDEKIFREPY